MRAVSRYATMSRVRAISYHPGEDLGPIPASRLCPPQAIATTAGTSSTQSEDRRLIASLRGRLWAPNAHAQQWARPQLRADSEGSSHYDPRTVWSLNAN